MARKRKDEGIFEIFTMLPWWASLVAAAIVYALLKFFLVGMVSSPALKAMALGLQSSAGMLVIPFYFTAMISAFKQFQRRRLLDIQTGIDSIRAMSWQAFEVMAGEIYRRQKYHVEEHGGAEPDGGIDLLLFKGGRKIIVQCKRWRNTQIGVSLVRELYGIMTAERADGCIFVSSGDYTPDALAFADGKPIELVDGTKLVALVREVQSSAAPKNIPVAPANTDDPSCPKCGRKMVRRTAKAGTNAGQDFWGCSGFPVCRGIINI